MSSSMASVFPLRSFLRRGLRSESSISLASPTPAPKIICAQLSSPQSTRLYTSDSPSPPSNETPSSSLRNIMRRIPHPVVIVTSAASSSPPTWRGITLSSFNCFSLNPNPLVSFNIKTPSSAAGTMTKAGKFAIHIFHPTPQSAFLASRFAQLGTAYPSKISPFSLAKSKVILADAENNTGPPLLGIEDDVLFRLHCETFRTIQIEDHQLWVGKVQQVDVVGSSKDVEGAEREEAFSLMYSDRNFRHVGKALIPGEGGDGGSGGDPREVEENMDDGSLPSGERESGCGSGR